MLTEPFFLPTRPVLTRPLCVINSLQTPYFIQPSFSTSISIHSDCLNFALTNELDNPGQMGYWLSRKPFFLFFWFLWNTLMCIVWGVKELPPKKMQFWGSLKKEVWPSPPILELLGYFFNSQYLWNILGTFVCPYSPNSRGESAPFYSKLKKKCASIFWECFRKHICQAPEHFDDHLTLLLLSLLQDALNMFVRFLV